MNKHTLIAGLMLSTAALAAAERPHIFPTPQQTKLQDSYTRVNQVQILPRKEKSSGGMWDILPADNEGAYALEITNGKLTVWANSKVALHYAKQTLSQLLRGIPGADNAQKDPFPGERRAASRHSGGLAGFAFPRHGRGLLWRPLELRGS